MHYRTHARSRVLGYDARVITPRHILLASASPRRRRLLAWLVPAYDVVSVETPEDLSSPLAEDPAALAVSIAAEKAEAARAAGFGEDGIVLCFDTIVVHDGAVLGKPADAEDARRMLRSLSGRTHRVVTGVAVALPGETHPRTLAVTTEVTMRELDGEAITEWMDRGEYAGCAGAYNIEGQVAAVTPDECHQNVAGLPLCHLHALLSELSPEAGVPALTRPDARCDRELGRTCRLAERVLDPEQ